ASARERVHQLEGQPSLALDAVGLGTDVGREGADEVDHAALPAVVAIPRSRRYRTIGVANARAHQKRATRCVDGGAALPTRASVRSPRNPVAGDTSRNTMQMRSRPSRGPIPSARAIRASSGVMTASAGSV